MQKILVIVVALGVIFGAFYFFNKQEFATPVVEKPVVCTMEAKLCPDGSYVSRTGPNCEFAICPSIVTTPIKSIKGNVKGRVTLSPTCPVERMPPDPACAPKPYPTSISILKDGNMYLVNAMQGDADGAFSVSLDPGTYTLRASGGSVLPRCPDVSVEVKSGQNVTADISCDSGIR